MNAEDWRRAEEKLPKTARARCNWNIGQDLS